MTETFDRFVQTRWAYAVLAVLVFIAALPGLMSMPTLDRDEGRFAEASSEMMETGDFVVIRYHEQLRNKKPVGIHWMQSAAVSLLGGPAQREIALYRIPSLLGAMLAAMAAFWTGSALFSRRAAFAGAVLLATCLLLTTEAHIAKTDAAQCGFITIAMGCLARMRFNFIHAPDKSNKGLSVLFWVCMAIGILLKGPIAPMVGGLTVGGLFFWERKYLWAKPLLYWMGISLACIMTIPWFIAVQIATSGEFMFEAATVDLGQKIVKAAEGHDGPPGMHLAALPFLFWPGSLLLVPGFWYGFSSLWRRAPMLTPPRTGPMAAGKLRDAATTASLETEGGSWRFLACWLVLPWLVFEIAPTKLVHYTLPMYPAIALICGAAFDRWFDVARWNFGRWFGLAIFLVVALALILIPTPWVLDKLHADGVKHFAPVLRERVSFLWAQQWADTRIGYWPSILIFLAAAGTTYAFVKKMPIFILGGLVACSLIGGISYRAVVLPNQKWILSSEAALDGLKELCALPEGTAAWKKSGCTGRAPETIRAIGFAEPSFVFAVADKVIIDAKADIPVVTDDNRPAWIINAGEKEGRAALDRLVQQASDSDRCIRFARRYAWNYSNGDPSILVAVVIEPAGCPSDSTAPDLRPTQPADETPALEGRKPTPTPN